MTAPQLTVIAQTVKMAYHATLSPSGASGWMRCAPKLAMEFGLPDQSSDFTDEGTAAHFLGSEALEQGKNTASWLGGTIVVWSDAASHKRGTNWYGKDEIPKSATRREYEVDHEMAGFVQNYVDAIHARIEHFKLRGAVAVDMLVEVKVEFSEFVGFPDQFGTSDVVLLIEWPDGTMQIDVNDLKFGRGVRVDAADFELLADGTCETILHDLKRGNEQMMIYALGAYDQFQALGEYTRASWCIHQPRLGHVSEAEAVIEDLLAWAAEHLRPAAERAMMYLESRDVKMSPSDFSPGEKQCMFCKAKGSCKAAAAHVFETIVGDFVDLDTEDELAASIAGRLEGTVERIGHLSNAQVGGLLAQVDFIEDWCKAVRAKTESELLAARPVPGYKLVQGKQGKQGNRAWSDEDNAAKMLKSFRLKQDQIYDYKLISPTSAEKLAPRKLKKGEIEAPATPLSAKQWEKLQAFIKRADGKPSVAPESDPRPALVLAPPEDAFTNLDSVEDDTSLA